MARERDWRVLLIDGDPIKRSLTDLFALQTAPGLMDVLADENRSFESCVVATDVEGLSVVPAGQRHDHTEELLASSRMESLAAELAESDPNRIVVFDSTPLLFTAEAPVLASHVGQVLVVVRAGRTTQQRLHNALSKLDPRKAISLVLNQAEIGEETVAYGRYDQYYYHEVRS